MRMPREEDGEDKQLGIRYEGEVLRGRMGVREAVLRSDLQARSRGPAGCGEREIQAALLRGEIRSVQMLNPVKGEERRESGAGNRQGRPSESPAEVAAAVLRRLRGG